MNIQAHWDFSKIPVNQAFTSRLMVKVKTPRKRDRPRRPLNVAVVLDHSGSMSGAKLERVKEATRILVEQLSPEDIFSLTVFDSGVTPLVAPMPVQDGGLAIARTIDSIHAGDTTNLSGGYLQGCEFVRQNNSPERINRVILLSDGLANEGITHPYELARLAQAHRRENITTSTIGVGSDFNEELMGKMAEQGGGSTYFIDHPDEAKGVFLEEMRDLKAVAAMGFHIRFTPLLPGVQAAQLNNYDQPAPGVYFLGDILEGIAKYLVLEVQLPPVPQEGHVNIGRLEITFREAVETCFENKQEEIPVELDVVSLDEFATVVPDREVILQAAYLTVGAVKAESIRLSDDKQFQEAAAVLENCAKKLREMQLHDSRLDQQIQELFDSARQLRHRGAEYYTRQQRKQDFIESELSRKGMMGKIESMRARREGHIRQPRPGYGRSAAHGGVFPYPCYLANGIVMFEKGQERILFDTGAPVSAGENGLLELGGEIFPLGTSVMGLTQGMNFTGTTVRDLSQQVGTRFNVLLGTDISSQFDYLIDLDRNLITFGRNPLSLKGTEVPLEDAMWSPVVRCRVGGQEVRCIVDTGAKISYIKSSIVANVKPTGVETDFFPGFGEFKTDVYELPIELGDRKFKMSFGTLPQILEDVVSRMGEEGLISTALFEQGPVCFSNQKNTLTLG